METKVLDVALDNFGHALRASESSLAVAFTIVVVLLVLGSRGAFQRSHDFWHHQAAPPGSSANSAAASPEVRPKARVPFLDVETDLDIASVLGVALYCLFAVRGGNLNRSSARLAAYILSLDRSLERALLMSLAMATSSRASQVFVSGGLGLLAWYLVYSMYEPLGMTEWAAPIVMPLVFGVLPALYLMLTLVTWRSSASTHDVAA